MGLFAYKKVRIFQMKLFSFKFHSFIVIFDYFVTITKNKIDHTIVERNAIKSEGEIKFFRIILNIIDVNNPIFKNLYRNFGNNYLLILSL